MLACVKSRSSLARAALIIFVAYILSNLTGYAQRAAIVAQFGADAFAIFAVANRVPELLFQVLAGGALASAFIPPKLCRLCASCLLLPSFLGLVGC